MIESTLLKAVRSEIRSLESLLWLTPLLGRKLALLHELENLLTQPL